jgi:hypothetical protein
MSRISLGIIAGLMITAMQGSADGCTSEAEPSLIVGSYHIFVDCVGCPFQSGVAVYQESNGIEGIQREDARVGGTCGGMIEPDALVFFV